MDIAGQIKEIAADLRDCDVTASTTVSGRSFHTLTVLEKKQ